MKITGGFQRCTPGMTGETIGGPSPSSLQVDASRSLDRTSGTEHF
jgi:hypothetical protein